MKIVLPEMSVKMVPGNVSIIGDLHVTYLSEDTFAILYCKLAQPDVSQTITDKCRRVSLNICVMQRPSLVALRVLIDCRFDSMGSYHRESRTIGGSIRQVVRFVVVPFHTSKECISRAI